MADGICPVPDCGRPLRGPLYCNRHRKRYARYGDPLAFGSGRRYPTPEERFWPKVNKTETCWLWTGYVDNDKGYGRFAYPGGTLAHRFAYELLVGPIPDGLQVDHKCRVKSCVNPDHLQAVTQELNMQNQLGAHRNNPTGIRGVVKVPRCKDRWLVQVRVNGAIHRGGVYDDLAEAEAAAIALRNRLMTNNLADREVS